MKATAIITENKNEAERIKQYLNKDLKRWESDNLIIVDIKSLTDNSTVNSIQDYIKNKDNLVILYGPCDETSLPDSNYHIAGLLSYSNVGYVNFCTLSDIIKVYNRLKSNEKKADKFGQRLYRFKNRNEAISRLKRTIDFVESDPAKLNQWLTTAKRAGFSGSKEEIFMSVRWINVSEPVFEGIFIEAEGTLFDMAWNFRDAVYDAALILSKKAKKPAVVIYGESEKARDILLKHPDIKMPCVPKQDLRGLTLDTVLATSSEYDLLLNYEISVERISTIEEIMALN